MHLFHYGHSSGDLNINEAGAYSIAAGYGISPLRNMYGLTVFTTAATITTTAMKHLQYATT